MSQQPEQRSGRGRGGDGPPQHEQRAIEQRAQQHLPQPRTAVGRQFEDKGGAAARQQRAREQPAARKRQQRTERDAERQANGRDKSTAAEEHGGERDQRREAAVAGHQAARHDRKQPFPGRADDPAAHDPGRIAA